MCDIDEYKVVAASSAEDLALRVEGNLRMGWTLHGGVAYGQGSVSSEGTPQPFLQAMTRNSRGRIVAQNRG